MHPNAFLKTFWRNDIRDEVFVAMSFQEKYNTRYEEVIRPAIEDQPFSGLKLRAIRVDNSKSGDSILTDIVDGIAHARLVLADVSVIDHGRESCKPIRNGNVMYEVGVALACRTPSEVLLVRDDNKPFLFDISTIPHATIDFKATNAIDILGNLIGDRLTETQLVFDARVQMMLQTLNADEIRVLEGLASLPVGSAMDFSMEGYTIISKPDQRGLDGLTNRGCVKTGRINAATGAVFYALTQFGYRFAEIVSKSIPRVLPDNHRAPVDKSDDVA